jgi:hypothetical protein
VAGPRHRHRTGSVIAAGHGMQMNRDAWPQLAEALGMRPR